MHPLSLEQKTLSFAQSWMIPHSSCDQDCPRTAWHGRKPLQSDLITLNTDKCTPPGRSVEAWKRPKQGEKRQFGENKEGRRKHWKSKLLLVNTLRDKHCIHNTAGCHLKNTFIQRIKTRSCTF